MRLREIQEILKTNLPAMQLLANQVTIPGQVPAMRVRSKGAFIKALEEIGRIKGFAKTAATGLSYPVLKYPGDEILVSNEDWNALHAVASELQSRGTILLHALDTTLPAQDPLSVAIRIPHPNTLDDLTETVKHVQDVLQGTIHRIFNETFKVKGFDVGSEWLELAVASQVVLAFIGGLLTMSYRYLSRGVQLRIQEEEAQKLEIGKDHLKALQEANAVMLEAYARKMAEELHEKHAPKPSDNENVNMTFLAIKEISAMICQGLEIRPALSAPSEAREEFSLPKELVEVVKPLLLPAGKAVEGGEAKK
jgi:hypothetical protein